MDLIESARIAWRSIRGHPLRSTLTTLGVTIGIGAVITFVTLGASLQGAVIGEVSGQGPPQINLWAAPEEAVDSGQGGPGFQARPVFTERDVDRIAEIEGVERVTPVGTVRTTAIRFRDDSVATGGVTATTPAYLDDAEYRTGGVFEQGEPQAVLNPAAAESFETNVSVGDIVTITLADGAPIDATVVGILNASTTRSAFEGFGAAPRVYVPTDPYYDTRVESPIAGTDQRVYATVIVTAESTDVVDPTQERIRTYVTNASDAAELKPQTYAFAVQTNEQLLGQLQTLLDQFTGFITGIAVLSLLVGSIGIANIMLVSVTERTREIGIMKAVGAQNRDVLQLFLTEAVVVGVIGAILGSFLGIAGGWAATELLDFPLVFPLEWFPIAITVGIVVGVLAGLYPAWSAARTDPIEALRYE